MSGRAPGGPPGDIVLTSADSRFPWYLCESRENGTRPIVRGAKTTENGDERDGDGSGSRKPGRARGASAAARPSVAARARRPRRPAPPGRGGLHPHRASHRAVIMPLVVGAIAMVIITSLEDDQSVQGTVTDSSAATLASSYYVRDIESARQRDDRCKRYLTRTVQRSRAFRIDVIPPGYPAPGNDARRRRCRTTRGRRPRRRARAGAGVLPRRIPEP